MILNATHHHGVIDPQVIVAALGAAAFLYARFKVTPVADPKDGNGQPLVAAAPQPAITVNVPAGAGADVGRQVAAAVKAYEGRRGTFVQPEVGLPSDYEPPSAALTPPQEKTLQPPAVPE